MNDLPPAEFQEEEEEQQSSDEEALVEEDWDIDFNDLEFESAIIGVGSFGKVLKGSYFGTPVALKKMYNTEDKFIRKYITRELNTLKNIHHPNIVQFMGLCCHETGVYIVTEFVPGGDLAMLLDAPDAQLPWKKAIRFFIDVAQAMAYLHARKIIHRDLKTSNLLVSPEGRIKVCDFGMARKKDETQMGKKYKEMTICGTDEYMAPEVIMGFEYDFQADVFSFGLCLYEVITRKVPIPRKPVKMYAFDVEEFKSSMAPETSPVLFKLVCDCCQTEPRHRIPFKQILKNFNQIVDESSEDPIRWKVASIVGKKGITKTMQLKGKGQLKELLDDPEEGLIQKMTISRIESPNSTIKKTQSPNTSSSSQRPSLPSSRSSSSIPAFKASVDSMERHRGVTEVRNPKFQQSKPVVVNRDIKIGNQRTTSVSLGEAPMKKLSKEEEIRFFKACVDGDLPSLKSFLQGPMDLNILNRDGETPLFVAIKYGHLNVVELILPLMTTLQINTPTKNGSYSLHQACRVNQKAVVQMLLDAGAKLKIPDKQKNYPLHIACEIGSLDIVQLLLSKGGKSILETCNELGETPLLTSYRFCHRPIIAILHQNQANPWVVDRDGKTPLFYAVKQGDIELVRQLISVGCEIDHPTEDFGTPLELAIKERQKEITELLLKGGATIRKKNKLKRNSKKFLEEILASIHQNN